jgi:hypothetical protein
MILLIENHITSVVIDLQTALINCENQNHDERGYAKIKSCKLVFTKKLKAVLATKHRKLLLAQIVCSSKGL